MKSELEKETNALREIIEMQREGLDDSGWFINILNLYANKGQIKLPELFNHRVFEYNKTLTKTDEMLKDIERPIDEKL